MTFGFPEAAVDDRRQRSMVVIQRDLVEGARLPDIERLIFLETLPAGRVALLVNLDKMLGLERETFTAQAACVSRC